MSYKPELIADALGNEWTVDSTRFATYKNAIARQSMLKPEMRWIGRWGVLSVSSQFGLLSTPTPSYLSGANSVSPRLMRD